MTMGITKGITKGMIRLISALTAIGLWLACLVVYPAQLSAQTQDPAAAEEGDKPLVIAMGYDKPPYVYNNTSTGLFVDIIRQSFAQSGTKVKFIYLPTRRMLKFAGMTGIDAIGGAPLADAKHCRSTPFMRFENVVIYDASAPEIQSIDQMRGKSVVGFQNAKILLGPEFVRNMLQTKFYTELDSQKVQANSFLKGRFDMAVMDRNIFKAWAEKLAAEEGIRRPYKVAKLFPWNTSLGLEFKDYGLCKAFNKGLADLIKSGEVERLRRLYIKD